MNMQDFAWNTSPLAEDNSENSWLKLAEALMESASMEEFNIRRDLLSLDGIEQNDEDLQERPST